MQDLAAEANTRPNSPAEGLLLAAKLHYQFVLIHPFDDGNGRMARILMNLVLMQYGFPPAIIKTEAKEGYFAALRQADGGQFQVFSEYISERVSDSLKVMIAGAKGEAIDDPDDLDKRIALLRNTLIEKQGGTPAPQRSPELLASWVSNVFAPLLSAFITTNQKFNEFYATNTISGGLDDRRLSGDLKHDLDYLGHTPLNDASTMFYTANFQKLKIPGVSKHDSSYSSSLTIEFGPVSYKLEVSGTEVSHFRYDDLLQADQVSKMMSALGNLHAQHLEYKGEQASKPS
jgi:Fic/DOC family